MCGLCGILGARDDFAVSDQLVVQMRDTMVHRGPDDAGELHLPADRVALGFRRLSIIDLSAAGHQPMSNEDGTVWIVFNGEIYNHGELRVGLEERGHRYRSRSDTETIVHLWEELGPRCVEKLEGMFALAIWDTRRKELFLARDRLGVKPLYLARTAGGVLFASEIKAILQHPSMSAELNESAFFQYLTFASTPAPETMFAGVEKLGPGERMTVTRDGLVRRDRYWSPFNADAAASVAGMSASEREQHLLALLRTSIRKRTMSDVPYGVFLSGGVDSSTNVALLAELSSDPVRTFSVGYRDHERFDELGPAREIARHFKTDHHEITVDEADFDEFLPELVRFQDEPLADWVCVPLYYVSKLARANETIVVQIGEGADELFHGYQTYISHARFHERFWAPFQRVPAPARKLLAVGAGFVAGRTERYDLYTQLAIDSAGGRLPFWGGAIAFRGKAKDRVLARGHADADSHWLVKQLWDEAGRALPGADVQQRMSFIELRQRLAELLLMRVDKMTMAASIEGREPFLDHHLVEFALALPPTDRVAGGEGKVLLKRAVRNLLPADVVNRPKQGFSAPVTEWFKGGFGVRAQASIRSSSLRERGLLDYAHIDKLWSQHRAGYADNAFPLWNLLNVSLWHDHWVAGRR